MNNIFIRNINLGGIADSDYQGLENSVSAMSGLDIHSEPGIIKVNQRLKNESGGVIDDFVKVIVPCSDGLTYLFGYTTGKIWKRTSTGVYSLEATASPAAGTAGISGADEDNGYIYYATQNRLGRVAVGAPTNWATKDDNWATFANGDADYHPFFKKNQVQYIGDGKYVAQVDAGVFSDNALDIAAPLRVRSLGGILTDLLIGTFVNIYRVATEIFRWNTWSGSFGSSDEIPETGINCFIKTDNFNLVNAGRKGNIYLYNGSQLDQFKRIPGSWSGSKTAHIWENASANMFGLPLFGLSNISGNPAKCGVYSLGGYDRNYPKVLNLEWLISSGNYENIDIGAIELVGTDLLVSWKEARTMTMTIASPAVVTDTAHGLSNGAPVSFSTTGALPTGVTAGTVYFARAIDADTFNLYDTSAHAVAGGSTGRINTSGSQSGVHTGTLFGVDIVDTENKVAVAEFETRLISVARRDGKDLSGYVAYRSLPTGTSIKIYYSVNGGAYIEASTTIDTDRKIIEINQRLPVANTVKVKVELNSNGNDAPEVEEAGFSFE